MPYCETLKKEIKQGFPQHKKKCPTCSKINNDKTGNLEGEAGGVTSQPAIPESKPEEKKEEEEEVEETVTEQLPQESKNNGLLISIVAILVFVIMCIVAFFMFFMPKEKEEDEVNDGI